MVIGAGTGRDCTRLDEIVTWLEMNPHLHDQTLWVWDMDGATTITIPGNVDVCNTACCIAGWTLLFDHEVYQFDREHECVVNQRTGQQVTSCEDFHRLAALRLGLSDLEAHWMFRGYNTLVQIRWMVTDLQKGLDITEQDYGSHV